MIFNIVFFLISGDFQWKSTKCVNNLQQYVFIDNDENFPGKELQIETNN